jgi:hypothetical protein
MASKGARRARILLVVVTALNAAGSSWAFQVSSPSLVGSLAVRQHGGHRTILAASDKEREIAELEKRLEQLKTNQSEPEANMEAGDASSDEKAAELPPPTYEPEDGLDMNAYRKRVANIKEPPPGEFLSEAWKESVEDGPGLLDNIKTAGLVLAVLAALVAFSQVPVGEAGLAKYSEKVGL